MAGHNYINPSNLFEDNDVDNKFVSSCSKPNPPESRPTPAANGYEGYRGDFETEQRITLERQRQSEIEHRMLDSSARSVNLLRDSETFGIDTATLLAHQHEILDNTNHRLDNITAGLTSTQNSINRIKSMFYGLKNYVFGNSDQPTYQCSLDKLNIGPNSSSLNDAVDTLGQVRKGNNGSRPSTCLRGANEAMVHPVNESQRVNKMLDDNLDEIDQSLTRLKGLGVALGHELDQQNHLLDTITVKVEGALDKIGSQNNQMNKLLQK